MGQLVGGVVAVLLLGCCALTQHLLTVTHTPQRSFVKGRLHECQSKDQLHLSPSYPAVASCRLGTVE